MDEKQYNEYIKQITPTHNTFLNVLKAFLTGGIICTVGQALNQWFSSGMNMEKTEASAWTLIVLIGLSILLTGLNIFPRIVKFGGAGALVPITGFANSVVAPAIEYKKEGQVFGIGCKIFTIAGPVILYGVFASWILGLIYFILQQFGIVM
jgi:stage V sporulation protein AC